MKLLIYCISLLIFLFEGTTTPFNEKNKDYSLDINKHYKYNRIPIDKGYVDIFNVYGDKDTLPVYKVVVSQHLNGGDGLTDSLLVSKAYSDGYQNSCSCVVTDVKMKQFKYVRGSEFRIKLMKKNLVGYSESIVKGKNMYNIIFYTSVSKLSIYEPEFFKVMNSLKINK